MRGDGERSRPSRGSGRGRGGSSRGRGGSSFRGRGGSPRGGARSGGYFGRGGGGNRSGGFGSGRKSSPSGQRSYSPPPRRMSPPPRRQYSPPPRRDMNRGPPPPRDHIGDSRYPSNGMSRDPEMSRYGREDVGRRGRGGYNGASMSSSWADRSRTPPPSSGPIRYRSRSPVARRRSSPGYAPRGRDRDLVGSGSGFSAPRSRDFTPRGPDHQPRDRGYSARSSQQDYRAPKDRDFGGPGRDRGPSQREFRDYGGARDRGDYGTSRVERREYSSRSYGGGPPAPSDYRDYQAQPISSSGYEGSYRPARSPRNQGGARGRY